HAASILTMTSKIACFSACSTATAGAAGGAGEQAATHRTSGPASRLSDIFDQPPIKVRASIPKKTKSRAVLLRSRKVQRGHQDASFLSAEFGKHVAALIADEAVTIEALAALGADAVGSDHWHDLADRVADHRSPP